MNLAEEKISSAGDFLFRQVHISWKLFNAGKFIGEKVTEGSYKRTARPRISFDTWTGDSLIAVELLERPIYPAC